MEHLFVARHGDCLSDEITELGRQQMRDLGAIIHETLKGKQIHICSSTADRATQSTRVLAIKLRLLANDYEQVPYLWSGADSPYWHDRSPDLQQILSLVNERREKAPGLILMTHEEIARDFPSYFYERQFQQPASSLVIKRGSAVHIDLKSGLYEIVPGKE